ncbi:MULTISPECIES: TonB-dependent receptor family protein [Cupriavidus]
MAGNRARARGGRPAGAQVGGPAGGPAGRHAPPRPARRLCCLAAALLAAGAGGAFADDTLPDVVVGASRAEQKRFDAPAAIDSVPVDPMAAPSALVNLSELLAGVPGVTARERQNYSQDLQLAVRGFGSRSTFGVRGVRLFVDGIPATMPDGQGQASTFDLNNASRIEVLRGPFAQMYGNASGGVVQVFTPDPPRAPMARASTGFGSDGQRTAGVTLGGGNDKIGATLDAWSFETDGYRDHGAARRRQLNAKVVAEPAAGTRLTALLNIFDQPLAQDPLGLTRAQAEARPRQSVPLSAQFDTGKTVRQTQGGLAWEQRLGERDRIEARAYGGTRALTQYLGFSGAAPNSAGGIVDIDRSYGGAALSWHHDTRFAGLPLLWSAGIEADGMRDARTGYVNQNGTQGAPRRDETDTASSYGAYAQFDWTWHPAWRLVGGVRASRVRLGIADHFVTAASPDDSGNNTFGNVSPVLGVVWQAFESVNVYANLGRGFETPTLTEVAYGPAGTGTNLGLSPSTSRQGELGVKWQGASQRVEAALFDADSRNEIVPLSNDNGRSVYQNVDGVRRRGFELAWHGAFGAGQRYGAGLAYTWLDAHFGEAFVNAQGQTVAAGARVPGTARHSLNFEATCRPVAGLVLGAEMRVEGRVFADDLNTQAAPGYASFNLRAGYAFRVGRTRWYAFGRIDNLADRRYIGSVIVNESNGRYFEPAPGRRFFLGLRAQI